ncbi:histidine kinase [Amnibacterium flavum]|uniref:histidine kinase n=1 Tax=Amnibacterium flavum TaxID=2173173 RepID=A0A2V1HNJ2_9MICO|nr:histidine kinase [Amnibacterium flavum]PVZ94118.1 sensor histidine kinase [Amnibacterium flavum]
MNDLMSARTGPSFEDRLLSLFSATNWVRYRFAVEAAVALLYLIVASLSQISFGGVAAIAMALVLAVAIVLHRIQPLAALTLTAITLLFQLFFYWDGSILAIAWFPVLVVIFGSAAYGRRLTKWTGLAFAGVLAVAVGSISWMFGSLGGLFYFVAAIGVLGIPWLAGALTRSAIDRRALGESVVRTEVRATVAEQVASLEHERNRVARDVHDIVAHSLAVVIAQADGARYAAKSSPEAVDGALETIASTARAALGDVRALLTELRHSQGSGPQPGMDDLDSLVRGFRESGLEIEWTSYGTAVAPSDTAGLAVYRVVQESLTNALRHGGRTRPVDLEFDWSDTTLTVTVTNDLASDGVVANPAGHGIPGMRERATLAGGSFSAGDGTNGRFRVRAVVPTDRGPARTQPTAVIGSSM